MSKRSNSLPELTKAKHQTIFIHKLYDMLQDEKINHLIWWTETNESFYIVPTEQFLKVLSQYFKHTNIASFIRQLNMYGFHKVNNVEENKGESPVWEFKHSHNQFRKGDVELLQLIKRRLLKNINKEVVLDQDELYYHQMPMVMNQMPMQHMPPQGPHTPHPQWDSPYGLPFSLPGASAPIPTGPGSGGAGVPGVVAGPGSNPGLSGPKSHVANVANGAGGPGVGPGAGVPGGPGGPPGVGAGSGPSFQYQQYHQFQQYNNPSNIPLDKYLELLNNFNHVKFELANLLNKFDYFLNEYKFQQKNLIKLIEILQSNNLNDLNNYKHYLLLNLNNSIILNDGFNKTSTSANPPDGVVQNYTLNPRYDIHKDKREEERPAHILVNLAPARIPQVKKEGPTSAAPSAAAGAAPATGTATGAAGTSGATATATATGATAVPGPVASAPSNPPAFHQPFTATPITPQNIFPTSDPNSLIIPNGHKPSRSYSPLLKEDNKAEKLEKFEKNYQYPFPSIDPPTPRHSFDNGEKEKESEEPQRKRSYQLPSISQLDQLIKMRKLSDTDKK